ncbi:MAG: hypothetical protein AAFX50_12805, partial [Acidobacteriota bacterium]
VERALEFFERSHRINPRRLASDKPARASDRIAETREELERKRRFESELEAHPSLADLESGSAARHLALADLLDGQGEARWARGHRLLAAELSAAPGSAGR